MSVVASAAPTVLPQQLGVVDLLTQSSARIDGAAAGYLAGYAVSGGDVNGDGRADMAVASRVSAANGRAQAGGVHVLFGGPAAGTVDLAASLGANGFQIDGAAAGDFADAVSIVGDMNGDARADVLVGAPNADSGGRQSSGSAYLVFGKTSPVTVDLAALGTGGFRIDGAAPSHFAGSSVSGVGDVNGDGRADVVVGAPLADSNGRSDSGSAYVVFGRATTTPVDLAALGAGGFRIDGAAGGDNAGEAVSGAGDVNGDGRADVLVGAPSASRPGRPLAGSAYVVFGKASTTGVDLAALGNGGFRIDGAAASHDAGAAVSGAGDVNGDARADVVVGAPGADLNGRTNSGSAYLVFGKATATAVDLAALGSGGFRIDGAAANNEAGGAVANAGDVNGDARPDVLVGAKLAGNNGRAASGSAYVVYGKPTTTRVDLAALGANGFRIDGAAQGNQAGDAVAGIGDWNGDRRPDVLVGAPRASNNGRSGSGSAYVVIGFGQPRLAYDPLRAVARRAVKPHAPTQLERTGPPSFQVTPPLPAGLGVAASGAITGTPTAAQRETTHTVTMHDLVGQATASLVVTVGPDRTRPRLKLGGPSPQRPLRQRRVLVRATCNEPCRLSARGAITVVGRRLRASIPLRRASLSSHAAGPRTLSLLVGLSSYQRLSRLLSGGRRARAVVIVLARDLGGNRRTAKRAFTVRR